MNEGFSVYGVRVWDILRLYKINMVNRKTSKEELENGTFHE
jgi:hypothetical protein